MMRFGLTNTDSFSYIIAATKLNEFGVIQYLSEISNIYENRVAIVFPLALSFRLMGTSENATTLMPFIISLFTIVISFIFGYFYNFRVAIIAALIVATLPQEVGLASSVLPDTVIPFYTGASLLCLWIGLQRNKPWLLFLSGVFLFFAFQSRATSGILIIPLILIALGSSRRSLTSTIIPAGTFVTLVGLFWIILWFITGDPFVQYKWLVHDALMEGYAGTGESLGYFRDVVIGLNPYFGLLFHLALLAFLVAIIKSRRSEKYRLPLLAFVCLYLFFEFGSTSLTTYLPVWKLGRFLTILTIPAALLIALIADEFFSKGGRWRQYLVFILLSAQVLIGLGYVLMFGDFITEVNRLETNVYERVIQNLSDYDGATVAFVHPRWSKYGSVYASFQGNSYNFISLDGVARDSLPPGSIVIFAPTVLKVYGERYVDRDQFPALDGLPDQIPSGWELLYEDPGVYSEGEPVYVYRVTEEIADK